MLCSRCLPADLRDLLEGEALLESQQDGDSDGLVKLSQTGDQRFA
jgi:hypothetical protein